MDSQFSRAEKLNRTKFVRAVNERLTAKGLMTVVPLVDGVDGAGKIVVLGKKRETFDLEKLYLIYLAGKLDLEGVISTIIPSGKNHEEAIGKERLLNIFPLIGNRSHILRVMDLAREQDPEVSEDIAPDDPKCVATIQAEKYDLHVYFGEDHGRCISVLCNEDLVRMRFSEQMLFQIALSNLSDAFGKAVETKKVEIDRWAGFRTFLTFEKRWGASLFLAHKQIFPKLRSLSGIMTHELGIWVIGPKRILVFSPRISEQTIEVIRKEIMKEQEKLGEKSIRLNPVVIDGNGFSFMD